MPTCASARSSPRSRTGRAHRERLIQEIRGQVARLKEKALKAGGLFVLGTERHESRRIDNQLRGRSGRQGDPGHSKFFLSLEDDLMRIFGSDKLDGMLQKLGLQENEAIVHPWINKALEKAQQKVEARNFDIRKNLLKFDNVSNDQRKVIFDQRVELMKDENVAETVADMRKEVVDALVAKFVPENAYPEQWNTKGLKEELNRVLGLDLPVDEWAKEEGIADEELIHRVERRADEHMAAKVAQWGPDVIRYVEKSILLQTLDHLWREHLVMLEHLRQVIGLRGYGQRDPLNEYKQEAFQLFEAMIQHLREAVTAQLMRVEIVQAPPPEPPPKTCPTWRRTTSIPRPARTRWRCPTARRGDGAQRRRDARARAAARLPRAIPTIPPPGARSAATRCVRAAPARSSSTATAASPDARGPAAGLIRRSMSAPWPARASSALIYAHDSLSEQRCRLCPITLQYRAMQLAVRSESLQLLGRWPWLRGHRAFASVARSGSAP